MSIKRIGSEEAGRIKTAGYRQRRAIAKAQNRDAMLHAGAVRNLTEAVRVGIAYRIIGDLLTDGLPFPDDVDATDYLRNAYSQTKLALDSFPHRR